MEDINDFDAFYTVRLQPFLDKLKLQSNDASKWSIAGIASAVLTIFCFIDEQVLISVLLIIFMIVCIYQYVKRKNLFIDNYKETVINEIMKYLNPGMTYKPNGYMSSKDYVKSGLFRHKYDYYEGSDFVKGVYKNVRFLCSQLETSYDGSSNSAASRTIFKGLFFAAPMNGNLSGATYIWPTSEEQIARSIMDEHYRLLALPKVFKINVGSNTFKDTFSVYGTNPSETRSIIDDQMMEHIIKFKQQIKREIRLSVVSGICYVSISIDEELFEPSFSHPDDRENIRDYFFTILLIFSIITQLDLSRLSRVA